MNGSHEANGTAVVDGATKLEVRWGLRMSRYPISRSLTLPTNHKLTFKTLSINSFLSRRFRCRRFSINQTVQNHHRKAPQMATRAKISRKCRIKPFPGHSQRVAWWLTRRKRKERSVVWFNRRPQAAVNFWSRFHLCTNRVQLESSKIFVFKSSQVLNLFLLIKMKNFPPLRDADITSCLVITMKKRSWGSRPSGWTRKLYTEYHFLITKAARDCITISSFLAARNFSLKKCISSLSFFKE